MLFIVEDFLAVVIIRSLLRVQVNVFIITTCLPQFILHAVGEIPGRTSVQDRGPMHACMQEGNLAS